MLLKSNKLFDLKSKKTLVKLVNQKLILLKTCDHTVEYWQLSINLCQFFNFLLHVTGKRYHFLRFNYLEMCYFLVYLHICETQVHSSTEVPFWEFHIPRFCDRNVFSLFLTKHLEPGQFSLLCNGTFTILMLNFSI